MVDLLRIDEPVSAHRATFLCFVVPREKEVNPKGWSASDCGARREPDHRREGAIAARPLEGPGETSASRRYCGAPKAATGLRASCSTFVRPPMRYPQW